MLRKAGLALFTKSRLRTNELCSQVLSSLMGTFFSNVTISMSQYTEELYQALWKVYSDGEIQFLWAFELIAGYWERLVETLKNRICMSQLGFLKYTTQVPQEITCKVTAMRTCPHHHFSRVCLSVAAYALDFAHIFPFLGVWMHENPELQSSSSLHCFVGLLLGLHSVIMTNKVNANNNFKQEDDIYIWMMKGNKSM